MKNPRLLEEGGDHCSWGLGQHVTYRAIPGAYASTTLPVRAQVTNK
ncbi:MAG: hypothetical protein F6K16_31750 [Symploca sp. SIO2B6]|nr:hypothetical protein [Symploca sp. SIO2B6]